MPEGPELHISSIFINKVCKGRTFGKISKSEVSKNPMLNVPFSLFCITACSRGKEMKLILSDASENIWEPNKPTAMNEGNEVLFTFGLAGKFDFCKPDEMQKHSHLNFYTEDSYPQMVLSFVDYMRFGKWTPNASWSKDRGPCVLFEYGDFRKNVLENLEKSVFNKPICEVLLNQKYFNGIGNYLRAEILYRHGTPPFVCARSVLEPLLNNVEVKSEKPDLLELCHLIAMEVVNLEGDGYDLQDRADDTKAFNNWLQCYYQTGMKNMADHNGRTIWFHGPAGPMAPKDVKTRARKTSRKSKTKKKDKQDEEETESNQEGIQTEKSNKIEASQADKGRQRRKRKSQGKGGNTGIEANQNLDKENSTEAKVSARHLGSKAKHALAEQGDTEPAKKISKRRKQQTVSDANLSSCSLQDFSISDLKLNVAIGQNSRLTRSKVKNILKTGSGSSGKTVEQAKTNSKTAFLKGKKGTKSKSLK